MYICPLRFIISFSCYLKHKVVTKTSTRSPLNGIVHWFHLTIFLF